MRVELLTLLRLVAQVCGKKFTMADITWHVSLLRFLAFGCQCLYEALPEVFSQIQIFLLIIKGDVLHGEDSGSPEVKRSHLNMGWLHLFPLPDPLL